MTVGESQGVASEGAVHLSQAERSKRNVTGKGIVIGTMDVIGLAAVIVGGAFWEDRHHAVAGRPNLELPPARRAARSAANHKDWIHVRPWSHDA